MATVSTDSTGSTEPLITVRQLAERSGLQEKQIRHLIRKHGLPSYRVSGVRVRYSEYLAWLASRRTA